MCCLLNSPPSLIYTFVKRWSLKCNFYLLHLQVSKPRAVSVCISLMMICLFTRVKMPKYPFVSSHAKSQLPNACHLSFMQDSVMSILCASEQSHRKDFGTWSKLCFLFRAKPQNSDLGTIPIISWLVHFDSVGGQYLRALFFHGDQDLNLCYL